MFIKVSEKLRVINFVSENLDTNLFSYMNDQSDHFAELTILILVNSKGHFMYMTVNF